MADYLKIPELARRLDVSEKTARRYVKEGVLPSVFIGGAYRVSEEDLENYLQGAKVKPGKAEAPPSFERSFNDLLREEEERRSLAFIKGLRIHFWDLRLRWKEPGNKPTPSQIRDSLVLVQHLDDQGAFSGSLTPIEQVEVQVLFQAVRKLRPIAEELAATEEIERLERLLDAAPSEAG